MRNQYQTYQDFMIQQPFFSFDVLHYEEQTQQEPFAARYYAFTTEGNPPDTGQRIHVLHSGRLSGHRLYPAARYL